MSHCPGTTLEDFVTDWFRVVDAAGEHGDGIRRLYEGQMVLGVVDFALLVAAMEPCREVVERLLSDFDEEEHGSWRDYCWQVIDDSLDKDAVAAAEAILEELKGKVPVTKGLGGGPESPSVVQAKIEDPFDSLEATMVHWPGDWSKDERLAWAYGIGVGWDADALVELAKSHGWPPPTVDRLKRLREKFVAARVTVGPPQAPKLNDQDAVRVLNFLVEHSALFDPEVKHALARGISALQDRDDVWSES